MCALAEKTLQPLERRTYVIPRLANSSRSSWWETLLKTREKSNAMMSYGSLEFNALYSCFVFSAQQIRYGWHLLINSCCKLQRGLVEFTMDKVWSLISLSKAFPIVELRLIWRMYDVAQLLEFFPLYICTTCAAFQAIGKMPWLTDCWNTNSYIGIASCCQDYVEHSRICHQVQTKSW